MGALAGHVLEIREGRSARPTLELAAGKTVDPMSIGRHGAWAVEATGILNEHVFLYYDGRALFVQSVDDGAPAACDGQTLPCAWTRLDAPCTLSLGTARIIFRSLDLDFDDDTVANAEPPSHVSSSPPAPPAPPPANLRPRSPSDFEVDTVKKAVPQAPDSSRTRVDPQPFPKPQTSQASPSGRPPPPRAAQPTLLGPGPPPRTRPPAALDSDDEATQVGTNGTPHAAHAAPMHARPAAGRPPTPAAGFPARLSSEPPPPRGAVGPNPSARPIPAPPPRRPPASVTPPPRRAVTPSPLPPLPSPPALASAPPPNANVNAHATTKPYDPDATLERGIVGDPDMPPSIVPRATGSAPTLLGDRPMPALSQPSLAMAPPPPPTPVPIPFGHSAMMDVTEADSRPAPPPWPPPSEPSEPHEPKPQPMVGARPNWGVTPAPYALPLPYVPPAPAVPPPSTAQYVPPVRPPAAHVPPSAMKTVVPYASGRGGVAVPASVLVGSADATAQIRPPASAWSPARVALVVLVPVAVLALLFVVMSGRAAPEAAPTPEVAPSAAPLPSAATTATTTATKPRK